VNQIANPKLFDSSTLKNIYI